MSVWYTILDPKFGILGSRGRARGRAPLIEGRSVLAAVRAVVRNIGHGLARRKAIRELNALDDRLLNDIGVHRSDVATVVDRSFARLRRDSTSPRETRRSFAA